MDDNRLDLEIGFPMDLPSLQQDSTKAKKEITGVGETAESVSKKVLERIAEYQRLQDNMANAKGWAAQVKAIKEANTAIAELHAKSLEDIFSKIMDPPDAQKLHAELANISNEFDQIDHIVDTLRKKLADIEPIDLADKDEVAAEVEAIAAYNNQMRAIVEEAPKLSTQLSSIKNAMADLAAQGKENTEEYRMLRDMAVQLEEAIKQTNEAIRQTASGTVNFDKLIRATSLLVAGFNIAQGAAALFGQENEEIQKSILRVTAAMSILQGLQEIQIELKKKDSVVTLVQTAAQRAYAIAVGQSVGAMRLLRLALIGLGIGAVVVGIILLIQRYREMRKEAEAAARVQKELNEAMESVPTAVGKARRELDEMAAKIRLAKEGVISKTGVLKEYNEGLGKTFGAAKSLNEAEQAIVKNGDAFIAVTMAKAKAMAVAELAAEKYSEMIKAQLKTDEEYVDYSLSGLANSSDPKVQAMYRKNAEKNRKIAVEEKRKEYEAIERLQIMYEYDLAQKAKETGLTPFTYADPKTDAGKKLMTDRLAFMNQLAEAERRIQLERMEENAREIEEIRDRWKAMREEARRLGLDDQLDRIDTAEKNEVDAAIERQQKAAADKERKDREARFRQYFQDYATFDQRRRKIIEESEKKIAELRAAGEDEQADNVQKAKDRELAELFEAQVSANTEFDKLQQDLDSMASSTAVKALKHGKDTVFNYIDGLKDATEAQKAQLKKIFGDWFDNAIANTEAENFANVAELVEGFGNLVEMAARFDGTLSTALKTIGSMVSQVGQLADTLGKTLQGVGGGLSKAGGWGAIIGAAVSVVGGIIDAVNQAQDRRRAEEEQKRQAQSDLQLKQTEAITKALERQLELINDLYGADRLNKYNELLIEAQQNYSKINDQLQGMYTVPTSGDPFIKSLVERLNAGESFDDIVDSFRVPSELEERQKAIDFFNQLYVGNTPHGVNRLSKITDDITKAREELQKLQQQAESGVLDERTSNLVSQLENQINQYEDTLNRLRAETTGTTFESISDELVAIFRRGTEAAEDFADNFDKLMQKALINTFKRNYLEEALQDWYREFADLTESGNELTDTEIDTLRKQYNQLIESARLGFESLEDIAGMPLTDPEKPSAESGISGRINRTIEESTASEILGFERARFDLAKSSLAATEEMMATEKQLYDATLQSIRHQAAIEQNTADTVTELRSAVVELKAINKNTKQTSTSYDRP